MNLPTIEKSEVENVKQNPREELKAMVPQSRTEYENTLLRNALADSTESCEKSIIQLQVLQQQENENRRNERINLQNSVNEIESNVKQIEDLNKQVVQTIESEMQNLSDRVKMNTDNALRKNIDAIETVTGQFVDRTSQLRSEVEGAYRELANTIAAKKREIDTYHRSFFFLEGVKGKLFWISTLSWIVLMGVTVYSTFIV